MYQQPDYYETRRSNKAQEMNQLLSVVAGLAQQKMQSDQSKQNALIQAGYIPNKQPSAPNMFQRFLGMGGGQNVPSPSQAQVDPNAPPQLAGYTYSPQTKTAYSMGVDASGNPTLVPVGNVPKGSVVMKADPSQTQAAKDEIALIAEGIKSGNQPPDLKGLYRKGAAVKAALQKEGFDLTKAQTDWIGTQAYFKNVNSTQQVRLGQAIESVVSSIPEIKKLNDEFGRTGWTPTNWVQLKAALTGTDPTKRDVATKYVTQLNLMKDETAQAFMAGGVPTEQALKMTNEIFNPVYGSKQLTAALDQIAFNFNIRKNAILSMQPVLSGGSGGTPLEVGGGSSDPYEYRTVNGKTQRRLKQNG
jgi:hypothetical protein